MSVLIDPREAPLFNSDGTLNQTRANDPVLIERMKAIDSIAWTGEAPWHRLGVEVPGVMTAEEALATADLDKEVALVPFHMPWPINRTPPRNMERVFSSTGVLLPFVANRRHMGVVRVEDGEMYGMARTEYRVTQNRTAFQLFDAVVGTQEAKYEVAGSLYNGKIIWMLARMPEEIVAVPGDPIRLYILLVNNHEPGNSTKMMITPVRGVCWNTINIAIRNATGKFMTPHVGDVMQRANRAREVLGLTEVYAANMQTEIDRLVNTAFSMDEMKKFTVELQGVKPDTEYQDLSPAQRHLSLVLVDLFQAGRGQRAVAGTKWAALNAVTEYTDWEAKYRAEGQPSIDRRMDQAWFGAGAKMKQRAYDLLVVEA